MRLRTIAIPLALSLCAACAREGSPARAPMAPEPESIEQAQQQIEDARQALGLPTGIPTGGPAGGAATGGSTSTTPPATPPAAAPPPADASKSSSEAREEGERAAENPCVPSCRAIASMRRAVQALCRLSGATDPRCADAKRTLETSERRVASCGC